MKKLKLLLLPIIMFSLIGCNNIDVEKIKSEAYQQGYDAGHLVGITEGRQLGYEEGYVQGYQDGRANGYDRGYSEGYKDGAAAGGQEAYAQGYKDGFDEGYNLAKQEEEQHIKPGSNIDIHSKKQADYLADDLNKIFNYATGSTTEDLSKSLPITLKYDTTYAPNDATFTIKISEKEDLSDAMIITTKDSQYDFYNAKLNTTYYWRVEKVNGVEQYLSSKYHFTTKDGIIRNMNVDGVTNMRDMGNFVLNNGKRIKQGLIYRSAGLDWNPSTGQPSTTPSQKELDTLEKDLGIVSEIDLANRGNIKGLTKILCRMDPNATNQLDPDVNGEGIRKVFQALAEPSTYPTVYHCSRGRDRTGAIGFLLGAILGMSQADLYRDFIFTNFGQDTHVEFAPVYSYTNQLGLLEGKTLQEQAVTYLKNLGITDAQISSIRNILIEE